MRHLYTLLWCLALPLVLARLWWRGRKEPGYRQHWRERLGFYGKAIAPRHTLWVHAVSVGETRASEPLVDALLAQWPESRIILTHMTPTGRATGKALFARHGERVLQAYLPYDIPFMVRRFIGHFAPRVCILMETEVWPNLVAACHPAVPVALVNARLSARSLRRGRKFGVLMTDAAEALALVAAQTEADAARVRALGARQVAVTGSIKFDVVVPQAALELGAAWRRSMGERKVMLCASTREGEEALILDAFAPWLAQLDAPLLVIVPRHPQRFDDVAALVAARGLTLARRSLLGESAVSEQVLLGDSMGEMFAYYAACELAFIGGSLLPLGGQNLIEACALGKPVLTGPHTFNFELVTQEAIAAGGALCVADAKELVKQARRLLVDETARTAMGEAGAAFAGQHRGATARTVGLLRHIIA
ncbi:lipid IV(A) 3-deoxy-D-manno-octulosonic acid transferase [Massilia sp. PAMC28688]|uniref:lipid IV(A) 3-deoxy-D-manno-octulosonic acid transferase n=1 Tax=Massilia sp. PAMC28688 TaxID=2861283 RepID=UPI001C624B13|nr:lipid IV(A) 3-deoxy-D-manno-octulosonic acid transferase [Massilia sp. PAMC28688]QYF91639.1 lipid IV(A) 3-deoxy-D-manno-octulosonic acid transferase [Massilia sp. PAMC28688]